MIERFLCALFKKCSNSMHYNRGRSFDEIIEFYSDDKSDASRLDLIKQAEAVLSKFYQDNLFYGDRISFFYKINDSEVQANLVTLLLSIVKKDSTKKQTKEFLAQYPFPITDEKLKKLKLTARFFIQESFTDYLRILSCSARLHKKKIELDIEALGEDFKIYDEVFAYEIGYNQPFDSIIFHQDKGILEIQIDMTQPVVKDDLNEIAKSYRLLLKKEYKTNFKAELKLYKYNIFPKIKELYLDCSGRTNSLNHKTSTGSVKREKMNSRSRDLNTELFHLKGYEAIDKETAFFEIQKVYDSAKKGTTIELGIVGGSRIVDDVNPIVNCAEFRGCIDKADYDYLLNKLI